MKASRLIELLAHHIADEDGGDFEVCLSHDYAGNMAENEHKPVIRAWLYPGLNKIIIGDK